ncbi:MAG: carbohydrate kinase, partial [Clostridia bacterium]|nr:carbohydrate kinase [Clostridia bacterium]
MNIAGLDVGTTGCKLTVFDEIGNMLGKAYRDYPVRRAVGGHEIDAEAILDSVYAVIAEMAGKYEMAGIGVTSFGETFVLTDEAGTPLYPAMLYTDPRGKEACAELTEKLGAERITEITGLAPHETYSISKVMWLKRHLPEIYSAAKRILLIEDFVVWHLSHRAQIDYSLAARTMAFDIHTLCWSKEIFEAAGIDVTLMSEPVPTGTCAGT